MSSIAEEYQDPGPDPWGEHLNLIWEIQDRLAEADRAGGLETIWLSNGRVICVFGGILTWVNEHKTPMKTPVAVIRTVEPSGEVWLALSDAETGLFWHDVRADEVEIPDSHGAEGDIVARWALRNTNPSAIVTKRYADMVRRVNTSPPADPNLATLIAEHPELKKYQMFGQYLVESRDRPQKPIGMTTSSDETPRASAA